MAYTESLAPAGELVDRSILFGAGPSPSSVSDPVPTSTTDSQPMFGGLHDVHGSSMPRSLAAGQQSPTQRGDRTVRPSASPVIAQHRRASLNDVHASLDQALASPELALHRGLPAEAHRPSASPQLGRSDGRAADEHGGPTGSPSQPAAAFAGSPSHRPTPSPQLSTSRRLGGAASDGTSSPRVPASPRMPSHRRTSSGLLDAVQVDSGHQVKLFEAFAQHVEAVSELVDRAADMRTPAQQLRKSVFMLADHYVRTSTSALGYYGLTADQCEQLKQLLGQLQQSSSAAQTGIEMESGSQKPAAPRSTPKSEPKRDLDGGSDLPAHNPVRFDTSRVR